MYMKMEPTVNAAVNATVDAAVWVVEPGMGQTTAWWAAAWAAVWVMMGWIVAALPPIRRLEAQCCSKERHLWTLYLRSSLHAAFVSVWAAVELIRFLREPDRPRYYCPVLTKGPQFHMGASFIGYLIQDMFCLLFSGSWTVDMLCHHFIFACVSAASLMHHRLCFPAAWLLLGEFSTIPLNIRWTIIAVGKAAALAPVNVAFAVSFALCRVASYGWGCYEMLVDPNSGAFADTNWWQVIFSLILGGYALQLWWFYKILRESVSSAKSTDYKPTEKIA